MRALQASSVAIALVLASCGDDVMESVSVSGSATESSSTSAATTPGTSDVEESVGPGEASSGAATDGGATTETSADSDGDGTAETTSGSTSATTESTGEPIDCASLEPAECRDAPECIALEGEPYVHVTGSEYCFDEKTFAGCIAAMDCDQENTYGCDGNDIWLFRTSCLPEGWDVCDAPEGDVRNCA